MFVVEIIVLRGIFVSMKDEIKGSGENYEIRNFMVCTVHPILCG